MYRRASGFTRACALVTTVLALLVGSLLAPTPATASTGAGWAVSGPGTSEVSDGSTASPAFRYATKSEGKWLFLRTATTGGRVTLPWSWAGDHGAQRARRYLSVGVVRNGTFVERHKLVDVYQKDGPSTFRAGGKVTLDVAAGEVYGFRLEGAGRDAASPVVGRFVLPPPPEVAVPSQPVTATTTDEEGTAVTFAASATDELDGALPVTCTPASGSRFPIGDTEVTCSATSSSQQTTSATFVVRVYFDQPNTAWPKALLMGGSDTRTGRLRMLDEALWYRFPVQPDSVVQLELSGLAANYDLTLFGDIGAAFDEALTTDDLNRLTAEFAADAYSPSAYSPSAYSPSAYSPSAYSPSAYSPSAYSPSAYSPSAYSPSAYSPSAYSPSAYSPSAYSPSAYSPTAPLADAFSPSAYSPSAYSEAELAQAYSSAQVRSLIAVSARDGLSDEHIRVNTWNADGFFYVRVQGRNGAFSRGAPFTLTTRTSPGPCAQPMEAFESVPTFRGSPGTARTVVLTDSARMAGAPLAELQAFASRPEIDGVVVDAATVPRVQALQEQADRLTACPYAKNLVAQELREIVNSYRDDQGTLRYVVIAGDDAVVPFFRYADAAGLGPEQGYVPPVDEASSSQAALRRNQYLGQDAYGAAYDVAMKGARVPVPDLAVGRLVETPAQIVGALDRYAALEGGTLPTGSALVTGYDFLTDAADEVSDQLGAALGAAKVDELVTDRFVEPTNTTEDGQPTRDRSWTADDLRSALLGERHDVLFLAGHFSANSALAADARSAVLTRDLAGADLADSLVLSVGCHSGYNIVDGHAVPGLTDRLDWPELFAREGATFIGGTGYQYGDTDLLEYSERLYSRVTRELRTGTGPVAVGSALLRAKQEYLASTPVLSGIHQKTLLQATLFGLPMSAVDLPGGRLPATTPGGVAPAPVASGPGATLGLRVHDLTAGGGTSLVTQEFDDVDETGLDHFTYLSGPEGVTTGPGQPALPLESVDVGAAGVALRGVGFRGGTYSDLPGVVPLTGAPTSDTSEVHTRFTSPVFFPRRLALPNTFGALEGDGGTRLLVTSAQYRSDSPTTSTLRRWQSLDLRLLYSGNTEQYGTNRPALAAPPAVASVISTVEGQRVHVSARVVGDPSAGIQQVWVTRTAEHGPWYGAWRSLDLTQDAADSTLWTGTLELPAGQDPADVRFVVQAANGVGLVTLEDNQGREFTPGVDPAAVPASGDTAGTLVLDVPGGAVLGETLPVTATLKADGPVAGRTVRFALGHASATAQTDDAGVARAAFRLVEQPGEQQVTATFDGDPSLRPATAQRTVVVAKRPTSLTLSSPGGRVWPGDDTHVTATLTAAGNPVADRSVLMVVRDAQDAVVAAAVRRTAPDGTAELGAVDLPPGNLSVRAYFGQPGVDVGGGHTAGSTDPENQAATSARLALEVFEGQTPEITTGTLPEAQAGQPYEATLVVTGDPVPQVVVTGLPDGLTYADGTITGTPTTAGDATVVVTAANRRSEVTRKLVLTVRPGPAARLTAVSGSGQAAVHGTAFAQPLVVAVVDDWGNPVPGATVELQGPATGAGPAPRSVSVATGANGRAAVELVAGPEVGSYDVVARTAGAPTATFRLTNRYRVGPFGPPFTAEDGATLELGSATTGLLAVPVSDGRGPVDEMTGLVMSLGCAVTLTDRLVGGEGRTTCLAYDVVQHRFVVPVSGLLSGWAAGTTRQLRVDVTGDAGELLGRRDLVVSVR